MPRFIRRGKIKVVVAPAVANPAAPTRAEINAGIDVTGLLFEINGFNFEAADAPVPDYGSRFDKNIPGTTSAGDSSLVFHDEDNAATTALRNALPLDAEKFLIRMPYGDTAGKRAETWTIRSKGPNDQWDAGNVDAKFAVGVSVSAEPVLGAVVP